MKLNPKECTFGTEEGMFIGHIVEKACLEKGIKVCLEKAEAMVQLQSPRTLKEVQSLNGKLASLNIFLSKSAKRSLPFFKTLKRCINMKKQIGIAGNANLLRQSRIVDPINQLQPHGKVSAGMIACNMKVEEILRSSPSSSHRGPAHQVNLVKARNFKKNGKVEERLGEDPLPIRVLVEEEAPEPQTLFTDESSCQEGSNSGLILKIPKGK
ncbi:hypothetical protein Tco_1178545 [Tanacetum coccineum]